MFSIMYVNSIFKPFLSILEIISPIKLRCTASGLIIKKVRSIIQIPLIKKIDLICINTFNRKQPTTTKY